MNAGWIAVFFKKNNNNNRGKVLAFGKTELGSGGEKNEMHQCRMFNLED